uniref:Major facilitator superfamily (MFS) profile domain-containing protein n=1 Tax=Panagrolaimus sp. ES5 TaxID=591445 RepID=A0AC34FHE0_9BILA
METTFPITKLEKNQPLENYERKTDWRSIYIANIIALLSAIQLGSIIPTIWPYLKLMSPQITETTYGAIRGAHALGSTVASGAAGYIVNRQANTKYVLLAGKILVILSAFLYLGIELDAKLAAILFLLYEFIMGISMGLSSVYRTHIAMASAEHERSKAFGLTMLATSIGFLVGPLIQMIFSRIKYPGITLLFGTHFNLFTAPVYLALILSFVGVILLWFWFHGEMHVPTKEERKKQQEALKMAHLSTVPSSIINEDHMKEIKYDKVAVAILVMAKVVLDINFLLIMSISGPYAMLAFSWSSQDSVTYQSMFMAAMGSCSLIFSLTYVKFKLDKNFYLITYPWWFIDETIPYEHAKGEDAFYSRSQAQTALSLSNSTASAVGGNIKKELVGCSINYEWCENTPRVNVFLYNIALVFAMGIGMPISQINLDILYSKVLGPIKQGVLQGIFHATGQILHIVGPVIFTKVYSVSGPRYLWFFEILVSCLCIFVFLIYYQRLVPFSKRVETKMLKRQSQTNIA